MNFILEGNDEMKLMIARKTQRKTRLPISIETE